MGNTITKTDQTVKYSENQKTNRQSAELRRLFSESVSRAKEYQSLSKIQSNDVHSYAVDSVDSVGISDSESIVKKIESDKTSLSDSDSSESFSCPSSSQILVPAMPKNGAVESGSISGVGADDEILSESAGLDLVGMSVQYGLGSGKTSRKKTLDSISQARTQLLSKKSLEDHLSDIADGNGKARVLPRSSFGLSSEAREKHLLSIDSNISLPAFNQIRSETISLGGFSKRETTTKDLDFTEELLQVTQAPGDFSSLTKIDIKSDFGSQDWKSEFEDRISKFVLSGPGSAEIVIHPDDLGPVKINISIKGKEVSLGFSVESENIKDAIDASVGNISSSLAESKIDLTNVHVSVNPTASDPDGGGNGKEGRGRHDRNKKNNDIFIEEFKNKYLGEFS